MVHFTPVQQLGESTSPYSIADQLSLSTKLLGSLSQQDGSRALSSVIQNMDASGVLSMIDMVWNHTAVLYFHCVGDV